MWLYVHKYYIADIENRDKMTPTKQENKEQLIGQLLSLKDRVRVTLPELVNTEGKIETLRAVDPILDYLNFENCKPYPDEKEKDS